jgi:hypothetical protein
MTEASRLALADNPETPIVFTGSPRALRGVLHVVNSSDEKVKLKVARVHSKHLRGRSQLPDSELRMGARLAPRQQAAVPAILEIDPNTPPGVYDAEIEIDGVRHRIEARVSEDVDLQVEPTYVAVVVENEREFEREFDVTNHGNVPLRLGGRCEVQLVNSFGFADALLLGLKKAENCELQEKLEAMLNEVAALQAGLLVITRESITLQPKEQRRVKVKFKLPNDIESFRHYRAALELYNATVFVSIYTSSTSDRSKKT